MSAVGGPFSQGQILQLMKSEFGRARRHGQRLACLAVRVDGAHSSGDWKHHLRNELARLVDERTRDYDHLGLIGDDGYLLVLPDTGLEGALVVGERIQQSLRSADLGVASGERAVTVSLGISATEDGDTLFFDTLLAQAEHARNRAMELGGDRIEVFRRERWSGSPDSHL